MSDRKLPDNIGRFVFPLPILWLSILATTTLSVFLIAGAVDAWTTPDASLAWKVMPGLVGLTFGAVAVLVLVGMVWRPRRSATKLLADSAGKQGLVIVASRRSDAFALLAAVLMLVTSVAGAFFAAAGGRIVLLVLASLLVLPVVGAMTALRRPRRLRLDAEGIESEALRSHTVATWDSLRFARIGFVSGGGGQLLARFSVREGTPGYREVWRNRLELKRTGVDVEYMMSGVDGESLLYLVVAAIEDPRMRAVLATDTESIARSLAAASREWPPLTDRT